MLLIFTFNARSSKFISHTEDQDTPFFSAKFSKYRVLGDRAIIMKIIQNPSLQYRTQYLTYFYLLILKLL